jgi:predicted  nucleic acid-binding Zn-ribbon protein
VSVSFERLLEVQEHDTRVDQLRHRRATLPERAELAALAARRQAIDTATADTRRARDELAGRQATLEAQIEAARARRGELEKRMFAGHGGARELAAMDDEVRQLGRHVHELENRELEVMEQLEPLDGELQAADVERDAIDTRTAVLEEQVAAATKEIDAEIDAELHARAPLAAALPDDLLGRYEALRKKLGGTGAARLVGNSCTGCHLTLPAMEVDRIKHASSDAVITCDNCGRILVR